MAIEVYLSFEFFRTRLFTYRKRSSVTTHTDKKENKIFLIYKEIQMGAVAKSYMRKGFLIDKEMCKYLVISEEAVSYI
jgi:hypothetical protein